MSQALGHIIISPDASLKEAIKKIDKPGMAILFVCDRDGKLMGTLTDGDIRRKIIRTGTLQGKITDCYNRHPVYVGNNAYTIKDARKLMLKKTIDVIPVIDSEKKIVNVLFWQEIFTEKKLPRTETDTPVVIMAGGKGERLGPFTKILPKPLIPVGELPIIEIIINRFNRFGIKNFFVTLNYKGEMIKAYLDSTLKDLYIEYIWEKDFLGTIGSLSLLPSGIDETFIVTNCDIIVDVDYQSIVNFHKQHDNLLTVIGAIQHYRIPYGIISFKKEGKIQNIQEKPEYDITVNAGLYVVSKEILAHIPRNKKFDMTDLIQDLIKKNKNVGVYPVPPKAYIDIGQWEEYKKSIDKLQSFI